MRRILLLFLLCISFYGESASSKPHVLVSIVPYKSLVEEIAGDTCHVYSIVKSDIDPHSYDIPPKHMENLRTAQLWFKIGEGFEKICQNFLTCPQIDLTEGVDLIYSHPSCAHHAYCLDTHTWLSPRNLKIQTKHIAEALAFHFPEHSELYKRNSRRLLDTLDALDKEILTKTKRAKQRHVLVSHGAFAYFCRDYDFIQHTIEKNCNSEPSPKAVLQVSQDIKQYNISSVILLKNAGKRSSAALIKRFNLDPILLDPYAEDVINNLKTIATVFSNL